MAKSGGSRTAETASGVFYNGISVLLRSAEPDDVPDILAWRSSDLGQRLWSPSRRVPTLDELEQEDAQMRQLTITAMIIDRHTGRSVGFVQAYLLSQVNRWCFLQSFLRPGAEAALLREANIAFIDYLFSTLNLRKIYIDIYEFATDQIGSSLLSELVEEGLLRDHLWYKNRYWDLRRMSVYEDRWPDIKQKAMGVLEVSAQLTPEEEALRDEDSTTRFAVATGPRTELSPVTSADLGTMFSWKPDLESLLLFGTPGHMSGKEEFVQIMRQVMRQALTFMIVSRSNTRVIGYVQASNITVSDGWCTVQTYLTPEFRESWLGKEASFLFFDYLFRNMNLNKIYIDVLELNLAWMQAGPGQAVGLYVEEGRFSDHSWHRDQYWDLVRFSVRRERWLETRALLGALFGLPADDSSDVHVAREPASDNSTAATNAKPEWTEIVEQFRVAYRAHDSEAILRLLRHDVVFEIPIGPALLGLDAVSNLFDGLWKMVDRLPVQDSQAITWSRPAAGQDSLTFVGEVGSHLVEARWSFADGGISRFSLRGQGEALLGFVLGDLPSKSINH